MFHRPQLPKLSAEDSAAAHVAVQARRQGGATWQSRAPEGEGAQFYQHIGTACLAMGLVRQLCAPPLDTDT